MAQKECMMMMVLIMIGCCLKASNGIETISKEDTHTPTSLSPYVSNAHKPFVFFLTTTTSSVCVHVCVCVIILKYM